MLLLGVCEAYPELGEGVGVVSQTQGVEGAAGVQLVQALNSGALAVGAVCLSASHEDDLQQMHFPSGTAALICLRVYLQPPHMLWHSCSWHAMLARNRHVVLEPGHSE